MCFSRSILKRRTENNFPIASDKAELIWAVWKHVFGLHQQQLSFCTPQPGWWRFAQQTSGPALVWIPSKGTGWSPTVLGHITHSKLEMALARAGREWLCHCGKDCALLTSDILQRQSKEGQQTCSFLVWCLPSWKCTAPSHSTDFLTHSTRYKPGCSSVSYTEPMCKQ